MAKNLLFEKDFGEFAPEMARFEKRLRKDFFPEVEGEKTVKQIGVEILELIRDHFAQFMNCIIGKVDTTYLSSGFKIEDCIYKMVASMLEYLYGIKNTNQEMQIGVEDDRFRMPAQPMRAKIWINSMFKKTELEEILEKIFKVIINETKEKNFIERRFQLLELMVEFEQKFKTFFRYPISFTPKIVKGWKSTAEEDLERYYEAKAQIDVDIAIRGIQRDSLIGELDKRGDRVNADWTRGTFVRAGLYQQDLTKSLVRTSQSSKEIEVKNKFFEILSDEEGSARYRLVDSDSEDDIVKKISEIKEEDVNEFTEASKIVNDKNGRLRDLPMDFLDKEPKFMASLSEKDLEILKATEGMSREDLVKRFVNVKKPENLEISIENIEDLKYEPILLKLLRDAKTTRKDTTKQYMTKRGTALLFTVNKEDNDRKLEAARKNCQKIESCALGADWLRVYYVMEEEKEEDIEKWHNGMSVGMDDKSRQEITAQCLEVSSNLSFLRPKEDLNKVEVKEEICIKEKFKKDKIGDLCSSSHEPAKKCTQVVKMKLKERITYYDVKETFSSSFLAPNLKTPKVTAKTKKGETFYSVFIPYVPVTKKNIGYILDKLKMAATLEKTSKEGGPFCHGRVELSTHMFRNATIEQCLRFSAPSWVIEVCAFAEIYTIGLGVGDQRSCIPRAFLLTACVMCEKQFETTTLLILHVIYEEDAVGIYDKDKDHSVCMETSICHCRLSKNPDNKSEKFNFFYERPVPICCIPFVDCSTMPVSRAEKIIIMCSQLHLPNYLPGTSHDKTSPESNDEFFANVPIRQNGWPESLIPTAVYINCNGTVKVRQDFTIKRFSCVRVDFEGHMQVMTIQDLVADTFEKSLNRAHSLEKFPGQYAQLGGFIETAREGEPPLKSIIDTDLGNKPGRVFVKEEILLKNVMKYCNENAKTPKEVERRHDLLRVMMQTSYEMATVEKDTTYFSHLKRMAYNYEKDERNHERISLCPMKVFATEMFNENELETRDVDFGADPNNGILWQPGLPETKTVHKIASPGNPHIEFSTNLSKIVDDLIKHMKIGKFPTAPEMKKSQSPKKSVKIRTVSEEFRVENAKEYLEEKAEKTRKKVEEQKRNDINTRLQLKMAGFVCDGCKEILKSGGKKPPGHKPRCYLALPPRLQTKTYNRWKADEEARFIASVDNNNNEEIFEDGEPVGNEEDSAIIENEIDVETDKESAKENIVTIEDVTDVDTSTDNEEDVPVVLDNGQGDDNNNVVNEVHHGEYFLSADETPLLLLRSVVPEEPSGPIGGPFI